MKSRLIYFFCFFYLISFTQKKNTFHKAKINYSSSKDLNMLEEYGISVEHGIHKKNYFLISDFSENELKTIKNLGLNYSIIIENVTEYYKNQNRIKISENNSSLCNSSNDYLTPENYIVKDAEDFGGFYTYDEMLDQLDLMHSLYPNLISERQEIKDDNNSDTPHIHETFEGRFLQYVKISDNPNVSEIMDEPQILYTSLHHAREPASLQQLIYYMWYILENYESNDEIKNIIDGSELFFVPCVNPDGYIFNEIMEPNGGGLWRKNTFNGHGVDNNRNYNYIDDDGNEIWDTTGTSNNPNGQTYPGEFPFSEAENRAIKYFVEYNDFKLALNNHTYGNLLLYPFGYEYDTYTEDNSIFEFISDALVLENGYNNIISSELYPASGDSDDFMYGMLETENGEIRNKIFAMTPEIGSSFWPQASQIENICKEMLYFNLTAAKIIGNHGVLSDLNQEFILNNNFEALFNFRRIGLTDNEPFVISLIPISENINNVVSDAVVFNFNEIGQSESGSILIEIDENTNYGDEVVYKYSINNGSYTEEVLVSKIFGVPITILEDDSNFPFNTWNFSTWGSTDEDFFSPETSITDSPYSNYNNESLEFLILQESIDLDGFSSAQINFFAKWEIESGFDYVQLEISNDQGNSWQPQCGKYTNLGKENTFEAYNEPLYDGNQYEWVNEVVDLNDYLGDEILIRFKLYTDQYLRQDGFYFDEFKILGFSENLNTSNIQNDRVFIYPTIVENNVKIISYKNISKILVHNSIGKKVLELNENNITEINLNNIEAGIYFIKLFDGKNFITKKLIKK